MAKRVHGIITAILEIIRFVSEMRNRDKGGHSQYSNWQLLIVYSMQEGFGCRERMGAAWIWNCFDLFLPRLILAPFDRPLSEERIVWVQP